MGLTASSSFLAKHASYPPSIYAYLWFCIHETKRRPARMDPECTSCFGFEKAVRRDKASVLNVVRLLE